MPKRQKALNVSCFFCHGLQFNETAASHTWETCTRLKDGENGEYGEFLANQFNYCNICSEWTRYYNEHGGSVCIGNCKNLKKPGYWFDKIKPSVINYDSFRPNLYDRQRGRRKEKSYAPVQRRKR